MNLGTLKKLAVMGQKTTPVIGVDLGVSSLKMLQLTSGEPPALIAAASVETPEDLRDDPHKRLDFQLDAVAGLAKRGGFKGRRVVCSLPATHAYCKHLQVQKTEGVSMGVLVSSALAANINCDPTSVVIRHIEVGPAPQSKGKVEVICTAAARSTVDHMMEKLQAAKLEPVGMHNEMAAALHAFDYLTGPGTNRAPVLYLDMGLNSTKIVIAHGPVMVFARVIDIAGRQFDRVIAEQLKVDLCTARTLRLQSDELLAPQSQSASPRGGDGLAMLSAAMRKESGGTAVAEPMARLDLREQLEMLVDEVRMCLRYHDTLFPGKRVERAVFLGGECRHKALSKHVATALGLPTQLADPLARVARSGSEPMAGLDLKTAQPGWTVTVGLCQSPTDL
jgi:type IV pilus assembly protein PilM